MRWRKMLAVDANAAFTNDRLKLYCPDSPLDKSVPSIFDRIWSTDAKKPKKRR
jgi:hypothetical protein